MKKQNNKITIGFFNDSFYPMTDGVIMVMDNYAKVLCKSCNVIVFCPKYKKDFDDTKLPYKVVRCKSIKIPFLDYSLPLPIFDKNYRKMLKNSNLDIVHIHSPFTIGSSGLKYSKKHNVPCVATMHSQFKQDFKRAVKFNFFATILNNKLIRFFNKCDRCFAVTDETARIFYEDYKYKCLPEVLENATEMMPVEDSSYAISYINKKHNIEDDEIVFLFVGRINILKNILFIIDSLKLLKEKRTNLKFKMLFVGEGQDETVLKEHITNLSLDNYVILCGKVTDRTILSYYYKRTDLLLFPSKYDTSSLVRIEAASQSTPGLFLKGTSTGCTITDNKNGFLSEDSVEDYSNKIIEILENKELYDKVSAGAFKDLYISWDDVVAIAYKNYLDLIKKY
ncbi:MAG: glycosyltransferase [bacterium]|nr:glycosyltransferase [bacterium]